MLWASFVSAMGLLLFCFLAAVVVRAVIVEGIHRSFYVSKDVSVFVGLHNGSVWPLGCVVVRFFSSGCVYLLYYYTR